MTKMTNANLEAKVIRANEHKEFVDPLPMGDWSDEEIAGLERAMAYTGDIELIPALDYVFGPENVHVEVPDGGSQTDCLEKRKP